MGFALFKIFLLILLLGMAYLLLKRNYRKKQKPPREKFTLRNKHIQ